MHVVGGGGAMEMIVTGTATYIKHGGSWMTMPAAGAMANAITAPLSELRTYTSAPKEDLRISDLGTVTIDGIVTHGYTIGDVDHPKSANVYLAPDGTIYQMTTSAAGGSTVTFSKYNAPITIVAPM
jgi:hypothetical protein